MERMISMFGIPEHIVERLKKEYPKGTRVELITGVDDIGTIHVSWDCGSSLGVAYGEDSCRKIIE